MDGILTVRELMDDLSDLPPDAPVMVAVIKYPEEFRLRIKQGELSWNESTDVDCIPLEHGEITNIGGIIHLAVELTDYDAQRHFAGG